MVLLYTFTKGNKTMTNYSVNAHISYALFEEIAEKKLTTVQVPITLRKVDIKNNKSKPILTTEGTLFRTERSYYIRFNFGKERWTVQAGKYLYDWGNYMCQTVTLDLPYEYEGELYDADIDISFSTRSKKNNIKYDKWARNNNFSAYLYTAGDGVLKHWTGYFTIDNKEEVYYKTIKYGPSSEILIPLYPFA